MFDACRRNFSRIATVVAAVAIIGSVSTMAMSQIFHIGGTGPVILQLNYACTTPGELQLNETGLFLELQADCDALATKRGFQQGLLQPIAGPGKFLRFCERGQQAWACAGVPPEDCGIVNATYNGTCSYY